MNIFQMHFCASINVLNYNCRIEHAAQPAQPPGTYSHQDRLPSTPLRKYLFLTYPHPSGSRWERTKTIGYTMGIVLLPQGSQGHTVSCHFLSECPADSGRHSHSLKLLGYRSSHSAYRKQDERDLPSQNYSLALTLQANSQQGGDHRHWSQNSICFRLRYRIPQHHLHTHFCPPCRTLSGQDGGMREVTADGGWKQRGLSLWRVGISICSHLPHHATIHTRYATPIGS